MSSTETIAFDAVIAFERDRRRTATSHRRDGYDLLSIDDASGIARRIEVKSTARPSLYERWLEPAQHARLLADPDFYVYAVTDCATSPRVHVFGQAEALARLLPEPLVHYRLRFRPDDFSPDSPEASGGD